MLLGGSLWLWHNSDPAGKATSNASGASAKSPVTRVKAVPIREGTLYETIVVFGITVPAPGALHSVTVPFESQVRRIWVSEGQGISKGNLLLNIEPSPDTQLQLEQARSAYQITKQSLDHMQERFSLKLATNDQLLQKRQVFEDAQSRLQNIENRGVETTRQIRAQEDGLIGKVYVQEGGIVAAGNSLIGIVANNRFEVRLGVEPEDIDRVHVGQTVALSRVNDPVKAEVDGRVRQVSRAVNPSTRLIDVFITIPSSSKFVLNEYVSGTIRISSVHGLIVPRSAVLPEAGQQTIFTVRDGRAVAHVVKIGLEQQGEVQVSGSGFSPGDPVVIQGNYELKDGLPVHVDAGS